LEDAFLVAEHSKAALLLENTKDLRAKTMAGVPDSLVERERDLRIELAYYKTNLYQAHKNKDTSAITAFEKNIFDSQRKLEAFKSKLERSFPAYFKLKYDSKIVRLPDVQKDLLKNTTVLQYFVTDDDIYCFVISRTKADIKRLPINDDLKSTVANYQKSLTDFSFIMNNQSKADSLYQETARDLYSLLMIGGAEQKLIIIPDDFLAQLNFGTLLYEDVNGKNYASLPYLATKHTISYAYSSAFLGETNKRRVSNFAGFAPSYDQVDYTDVDSAMHPMAALVVRSGNLPLPGATEEVNAISKLMNGESWINEEATETNFKKYSGDYDVLHLAMHSLLNDEEPRYSELLFNHRKDNENDGYLTIAEIYNLKLNAQLVVLSACSSGFGKIQNGEGPISLSRAFSYAGCPSVVMSLWKVPDLVTTSIMKNFYESLSDGLSKDEALQAAQVKFLNENKDPIYSHPYYWAGFVVIGDNSPLERGTNWGYYLIGISVVAVTVVLVRRFRKQGSES
ncbi:MAG TPA: CHAT domain-containing protein, partial [Cyclobacteriaceae bacterium]|nr:CHAT domain-containing protein [Cyclobacteriaceae bacterium]